MNEVIHCPECRRRLELPEDFIGKHVQCPACHRPFVAQVEVPLLPTTSDAAPRVPNLDEPYRPPAKDLPPDLPPKPRHPRSREDDRRNHRAPRPSFQLSHRGGAVFTLGLFAILIPVIGLFLAIAAWNKGSHDLRKMRTGEVDDNGESLTRIGMLFAVFAIFLQVLSVFFLLMAIVLFFIG